LPATERPPVIGLLAPVSSNEDFFRQGLKQAGFEEGENVSILYRFAENEIDRLPALADDLARRRVAVIATIGHPAVFAAKAATTTIPIVFVAGEDPVKLGLVASLARPGGNLTGVNIFSNEMAAKRLQLLRELMPSTARVAVLVDPASPTAVEATLRDLGTIGMCQAEIAKTLVEKDPSLLLWVNKDKLRNEIQSIYDRERAVRPHDVRARARVLFPAPRRVSKRLGSPYRSGRSRDWVTGSG
jgi:ABC transporter substrate binding protein